MEFKSNSLLSWLGLKKKKGKRKNYYQIQILDETIIGC